MLEDYDTAFVTKLGATLDTADPQRPRYVVAVSGIASPVEVGFGLPEEWYKRYTLPGINVSRMDILPDPSRMLPRFKGKELSMNPDTPNTFNIQKEPTIPVDLLYKVELAAESAQEMNALVMHSLLKLPTQGFGTYISVFGHIIPFRSLGVKDRTDYDTTDGRVYRYEYTYVVEAWLASLECLKVKQILTVDLSFEVVPTGEPL